MSYREIRIIGPIANVLLLKQRRIVTNDCYYLFFLITIPGQFINHTINNAFQNLKQIGFTIDSVCTADRHGVRVQNRLSMQLANNIFWQRQLNAFRHLGRAKRPQWP